MRWSVTRSRGTGRLKLLFTLTLLARRPRRFPECPAAKLLGASPRGGIFGLHEPGNWKSQQFLHETPLLLDGGIKPRHRPLIDGPIVAHDDIESHIG